MLEQNLASSDNQHDFEALAQRMTNLENEINEYKNRCQDIMFSNKSLKKEIIELTTENEYILDEIYNLQINVAGNNQYTRRENIELINIPERIKHTELEGTVIKILNCIGVKVSSYKLVAVHRIGRPRKDSTRNVIVRFINRKDAIDCHKNKKQLPKAKSLGNGFGNIYIIENLCPENKRIFDRCYKLKSQGIIKKLWSFNGVVNIKFSSDYEEKPTKIFHYDDIDYMMHYDSLYWSSYICFR